MYVCIYFHFSRQGSSVDQAGLELRSLPASASGVLELQLPPPGDLLL